VAEAPVVQSAISRPGQSQADRVAAELDPGYAPIDDRSTEGLLDAMRGVASLVRFHRYRRAAGGTPEGIDDAGRWTTLLPETDPSLAAWRVANRGEVPPHFALLLTFLDLFREPQRVANDITRRHLDFQYQDVLRLAPRAPVPDRAHVVLELKKAALAVTIGPSDELSAGKDATGAELRYAPTGETVISAARVESLRTVFLDRGARGTVRVGPIANSSDGQGGALPKEDPSWEAFGQGPPRRPVGEVGFAIASPVLRMREGRRTVTLRLVLSGGDSGRLTPAALAGAFEAFLTGEKHWIEPDTVTATFGPDQVLTFTLALSEAAEGVVDYQPAVHGYAYATGAPVVQLLLRGDGPDLGYDDLAEVVVRSVSVAVDVDEVAGLTAEGDAGSVDTKRAFLPFGPEAAPGSRFMVAAPEALAKKLTALTLHVEWKDASHNFANRYAPYASVTNASFTAAVRFRDAGGTEFADPAAPLFESADAALPHDIVLARGVAPHRTPVPFFGEIRALEFAGSVFATAEAQRRIRVAPRFAGFLSAPPVERPGYVTVTLNQGFFHPEYRKAYVDAVITAAKGGTLTPPAEPYTPTIRRLTVGYRAVGDEVPISSGGVADLANADAQFFHVHPFGPSREHRWLREQRGPEVERDITLLPRLRHAGELLIGVAGIAGGDSVSLLFQAAPGTADPDLPAQPIRWFALCDNYWKPLDPAAVVLDTTNGLLGSGIVRILVPLDATTVNTLLPSGPVWLKAAVDQEVDAVPRLLAVMANGIEVRFQDRGNDPVHLAQPLPAGSIARLVGGVAEVKGVSQPFASFGGEPRERDGAFRTRVSERLRHKNRCVTSWDYERIVLEAFPQVHRVKCVPHARPDAWASPGDVLLVVVPYLRRRNGVDRLRPRVDADTMSRIHAQVQARAGMQVRVHVSNPRYQPLRLRFAVRFAPARDVNQSLKALQEDLVGLLSPWVTGAGPEVTFGGALYRPALLYFVERLPYVDYVRDFQLLTVGDHLAAVTQVEVHPATPDTIFVSDVAHDITPIP
jgi:Baseplate J-like protein